MAWIPGRVVFGAALVAIGVGALFLAGSADGDARYFAGLGIFALSVLGVFALISTAWGASPVARFPTLPANGAVRWAIGGAVAVAGTFGLFQAQATGEAGFAYYNGLALFALAVAYDFLLLKDWFDRTDARRR